MNVAIRADGDSDIGFGHLVRTSALAEALLNAGHGVTVATVTPENAKGIYPDDCSILAMPSPRGDPEPLLDVLDARQPDAVITDAYPVDTAYQQKVWKEYPLVVIQDDARHTVCADAVVNGNLYAPSLDYDVVGPEPRWCLGPEYLLLRDSVTSLSDRTAEVRDPPERVVVTLGGSDPHNLTPSVLRALDGVGMAVTVIVGPGFTSTNQIDETAAAIEASVETMTDPDPAVLAQLFFEADIAVCGCGTTTYELLALGTPFVAVVQADNQRPIANALAERELASTLSRDATTGAIRGAVEELAGDSDRRADVCRRGRALVDGDGRKRVARAVEAVTT